jgi:hypothetical protein
MEPRREEPKAPKSRPAEKRKRFRIVKLEERIAPTQGKTQWDCHTFTHGKANASAPPVRSSKASRGDTLCEAGEPAVPVKADLRWLRRNLQQDRSAVGRAR